MLAAEQLDKVLRCVFLPLSLRPAAVFLCPWRRRCVVIVKRLQQHFVESRVERWWRGRQRRDLALVLGVEGRVKRVPRWGAEREQEHVRAELNRLRQVRQSGFTVALVARFAHSCTGDRVNTSCNQWRSHADRCGHLPAPTTVP